jgi:adenine-specific DNA-methyltransferase
MPTLDWLNRASAFTTAAKVPYRLLEQVSAHTSHAENTTNLIAAQLINTPARGKNGTKNGLNSDNLLIQGDKRPASGNVLHRDGLNMKQQLDALLAA